MKRVVSKSILGLAAAGFLFTPGTAQEADWRLPEGHMVAPINPGKGETAFDIKLKGYVFGIKLMDARFKGNVGKRDYSVYSDMKTSGIAALVKKQRLWSWTIGRYNKTDMRPMQHIQQNMNKKSRRIREIFNYKEEKLILKTHPPHGSMGKPPATEEQRFWSDDVNSALLKIVMMEHRVDGEVCEGTIPVFDGKQHYNLLFKKVSEQPVKFDGRQYPGVKCHAWVDPVSGFDPEDLPSAEEKAKPVTFYMINRPEFGAYMPVKFTYKISGFSATVKVVNAQIKNG